MVGQARGLCSSPVPIELPHFLILMFAFVTVGNALIWWGMAKRHAHLRRVLSSDQVLFQEQDVRVTASAWSALGASIQWMQADVWITDRAAVLFMHTFFGMPQAPIALFRSAEESAANKRWLVTRLVVGELVIHEAEQALSIRSAGGFSRRKLKLRPSDPEALTAALEACLNRTPHTGRAADPRA